mgnify:CR=1 FL=1
MSLFFFQSYPGQNKVSEAVDRKGMLYFLRFSAVFDGAGPKIVSVPLVKHRNEILINSQPHDESPPLVQMSKSPSRIDVARKMLGNAILTPSSSEEEIQKTFDDFYISEENQAAIRQALADGKTVYRGCVNFECCEETQAEPSAPR